MPISIPSGNSARNSGKRFFTSSHNPTTLAPLARKTPMPTEVSRLKRPRPRRSLSPSSTSATSASRTIPPSDAWATTIRPNSSGVRASPIILTVISCPSVFRYPAGRSTCSSRKARTTSSGSRPCLRRSSPRNQIRMFLCRKPPYITPPHPGIVWIRCLRTVSTKWLISAMGRFPWVASHMTGNLLKLILLIVGGSMSEGRRLAAAATAFCTSCMAASISRWRWKNTVTTDCPSRLCDWM